MLHHTIAQHSTSHYYIPMFHATSHRRLVLQHISPRTTIFYIWHHITLQSASASPRLTAHVPHRTVHTIPHPQLFTPHPPATSQHILHHHITLPHLDFTYHHIWTHCIIFHIWRHTTVHCISHILHHHNFSSHRHCPHFALCNITHTRTPHSTPPYSTQLHFNRTMSEIATFHIAPHFTSVTPTFHTTPCPSPHSIYIYCHITLSHSTHSKPHYTSYTAFQPSYRIAPP